MPIHAPHSRRDFLARSAALAAGMTAASTLGPSAGLRFAHSAEPKRPRVAAIFTELRFRSHAFNILENFFEPFLFRGRLVDPGVDVVAFYADQFPDNDMAREVSRRLKAPLFPTIEEALCLGGDELAVDAVLAIVEHGDYPDDDLGRKMYPRKDFFDRSLAVMQLSKRFVPYFNDKGLSHRFDWAKQMYDAARRHGVPLMAGSSVPLAQRIPAVEVPENAEIEEAVAIHGGGLEVYGFHGFEVLQSMIEGRRGGETGIVRIETLTGDAYRKAKDEGRWSRDLFDAAMAAETDAGMKRRPRPAALAAALAKEADEPHAIVADYKDGLRATVLKHGRDSNRWNFACRIKGSKEPLALAWYNGPWGNRCLFKALSHAIQRFFLDGKSPYPVERTLLASGATDAAVQSHHAGKPLDTPQLAFAYSPQDFARFRETGASWRVLTSETPEHETFTPGDPKR